MTQSIGEHAMSKIEKELLRRQGKDPSKIHVQVGDNPSC